MTATEPDDGPVGEVPPAVLAYETRLDVTRAEVVRLTIERDDYATRLARVGVANLDLLAEVERLTARLRAVEALAADMERQSASEIAPVRGMAIILHAALATTTEGNDRG